MNLVVGLEVLSLFYDNWLRYFFVYFVILVDLFNLDGEK